MSDRITQKELKKWLDYDPLTGVFTRRIARGKRTRVGAVAGSRDITGYCKIYVGARQYFAHRLAWLYVYGKWPEHMIDHIDRNRANNAIANLRDVTPRENSHNRAAKGCYLHPQTRRWFAAIRTEEKLLHLGTFNTKIEARAAYLVARVVHFQDTSWMRR